MEQIARGNRVVSDTVAEIAVKRKSACGHDCSQCGGGCSEMLVQSEVTAMAFNPLHARAGDTVQVESETKQVLSIAAVVYLVPLILFFLLYAAGRMIAHVESVSIALGGLGFFVGIAAAVYANSVVKRRRLTSFRITAILD